MPKKLVIRINNLQEKEQEEENYDRFVVTTVHWNRIIAAAVGLLVAVALVVWVIVSVTGGNSDDQANFPAMTSAGDDSDVFRPEASADNAFSEKLPPPAEDNGSIFLQPSTDAAADSESSPDVSPVGVSSKNPMHPDTAAVASAEQLVSEVVLAAVEAVPQATEAKPQRLREELPQVSEAVSQLKDDVSQDTAEVVTANDTVSVTADGLSAEMVAMENFEQENEAVNPENQAVIRAAGDSQLPPTVTRQTAAEQQSDNSATITPVDTGAGVTGSMVNPVHSSGSPAPVIIHSRGIKTAQLTTWVAQQQPRDQLGSVVYLAGDELLRIFLFTEMSDLKGQTLYHDWYLDDKPMAQVRIPVSEDELAASSSKFIDQYMLGRWKVIVTNGSGKLFITAGFEVRAG